MVIAIRFSALSVLLFGGFLQAQTFKGYQIGETTADFLKSEPALQAKLSECQETAPRELTPDEIEKRYGRKAYEEYLKKQAQNSDASRHIAIMSEDTDLYGDRCAALLSALAMGNGRIDGNGYDTGNAYSQNLFRRSLSENNPALRPQIQISDGRSFLFRQGLLISLSLTVLADYIDVREDVTKRLGVTPTETSSPYHNAYGATWNNMVAVWDNENLHIELFQDNNPSKPSPPKLSVQSQELHQEYLENRRKGPSPLD